MAFIVTCVANQTTSWIMQYPQSLSQTLLLHRFSQCPRRCLRWIDKMSDQYSSTYYGNQGAFWLMSWLDHLSNREFAGTQDDRNFLAGMPLTTGSIPFITQCATVGFARQSVQLTTSCRKCARQKFTFSASVFNLGKQAMNMLEIKVHRKMERASGVLQGGPLPMGLLRFGPLVVPVFQAFYV